MPVWKEKGKGKGSQENGKGKDGKQGKGKGDQGNWKGKDAYQVKGKGYQENWKGKDGYQGKGKGKSAYQAKGSGKDAYYQGKGTGKDASKSWQPHDATDAAEWQWEGAVAKGSGKDAAKGWQPKDPTEIYKTQLQTQACQILVTKPDGICGGHLSQLLTEADGDSVVAAFGTTGADGQNGPNGQKLQRGWLHSLMRDLPNVKCERHGGGRDNMYTSTQGVVLSPVMNAAAAPPWWGAYNAQLEAIVPAASMNPEDFLGDWNDSLGNSVSVLQWAKDAQFTVVLKRPPSKEVVLSMFPQPLGGGYMGWCCGNSYLQLESSTSMQLVWLTADGRMSMWLRAPATDAAAPSTETPAEAHTEKASKSDEGEATTASKVTESGKK